MCVCVSCAGVEWVCICLANNVRLVSHTVTPNHYASVTVFIHQCSTANNMVVTRWSSFVSEVQM